MADNPFADNPFAVSSSSNGRVPPAAGAWNSSTAGAWGGAAAAPAGAKPGAPVSTSSVDMRKEADLARREADLNRRETELRRLEMELRNNPGGKPVKNWPKFFPVVHHDINSEIPAAMQGTVKAAYWAYVGLCLCLFMNFIGTTALLITDGEVSDWLWSALYLVGGVPGAYVLWYSRLYNAAIKDSAFGYGIFFLFFIAAHLVFTGWSAVGPPFLNSKSHTGIIISIDVIGDNTGVGIVYFIGAGLWCLEFLWSFWSLQKVYAAFRGKGMTVSDVKRGAARTAVATAV